MYERPKEITQYFDVMEKLYPGKGSDIFRSYIEGLEIENTKVGLCPFFNDPFLRMKNQGKDCAYFVRNHRYRCEDVDVCPGNGDSFCFQLLNNHMIS